MLTPILTSYDDWRRCIEIDCGIALTTRYIGQRIAALEESRDEHTMQFVRRYGEAHRRAVQGYFAQALMQQSNHDTDSLPRS